MSCRIAAGMLFAIVLTVAIHAAEAPDLANVSPPADLLAPDAKLTVASGVCFLEGPAVDAAGNVYFSDIAGNRILKRDPAGNLTTFRADSGRTNGNTFDAQGRLVSCEGAENGPGGGRRIVRTDLTSGKIEVLTERYEGKRYNSPNDVVVDPQGRIWFTDPLYAPDRSIMEQAHEAVYRIDTDGTVHRVVTQPAIGRPNGLAITPDGKTLYLIDSNYIRPDGNRKIWAFAVGADGSISGQRQVFDFGRGRGGDGMRLDSQGNLWVAAGISAPRTANETADVPTGVYVITPQGKLLGRIPIPEDVITNLAFGGPDKKTLYVTAGKTLFQIPTSVAGYSLFPR
ncbi:MAG: SMP-30/gluconolactonase/LRE family protein [Planctomycetaceae bacterium]|nr:SMP-30/gluconolactonase/LRE family protein [Planctomycetaceae bacterium]